jgi:hypothetical protein
MNKCILVAQTSFDLFEYPVDLINSFRKTKGTFTVIFNIVTIKDYLFIEQCKTVKKIERVRLINSLMRIITK